ncbi:MAG: hypothetical protein LBT84_01885 [Spirochaetia bacterium]|jgi:hypothetical protein|nr:hypothetical protein [Spirochaetia bacterium]
MKHSRLSYKHFFILFALALSVSGKAAPHTLSLTGGIDTFAFNNSTADQYDAFITPYILPIGQANFSGDFGTFILYDMGFDLDTIFRYTVRGAVYFNIWMFRLGVGSFVLLPVEGLTEFLPGVEGSLGFEAPGYFRVNLDYGLNVFTEFANSGPVNVNKGKIEAAIWFPILIARAFVERKSFTRVYESMYFLRSSLNRYAFFADIFFKNKVPVFSLGVGFETAERAVSPLPSVGGATYILADSFSLEGLFVAAGLALQLSHSFEFHISGEFPVSVNWSGLYLKAQAGINLTFAGE